jgi:hypothetical protein
MRLKAGRLNELFAAFVANGILGVRDMGFPREQLNQLQGWREKLASGAVLGPRLIAAGLTPRSPTMV